MLEETEHLSNCISPRLKACMSQCRIARERIGEDGGCPCEFPYQCRFGLKTEEDFYDHLRYYNWRVTE